MTLKELPLGNQSFARIIDDNLLYADKTRYVYNLVTSKERNYFLSRPRRFGKTLLLSVLEELFTGHRERFQGLWIDGSDYDFPRFPVLRLSLSLESGSPEIFQQNLINRLKDNAQAAKLRQVIEARTPAAYFEKLIKALSEEANSEIAVLIDEYDAPVTRNLDNSKIAKANAKILHDFFANLKDDKVSPCVGFTLVTGITRYALTSMDSGPNHLKDISLNPKFAGLCGFTLEEFDSIFADWLAASLPILKETGEIEPNDTERDLREKILSWYDGYNWGGETRVLNPFSILNFFADHKFDSYWILSGRPDHLTALIKKRPLDFLENKLRSYISKDLRKTGLTTLRAIPVLFHSGYLTVDTIKKEPKNPLNPKNTQQVERYYFRHPNFEVSSSYFSDCFCALLDLETEDELKTQGDLLQEAFLARDAATISGALKNFFSSLSYHQRPDNEKTFHLLTQSYLLGMGFKVQSEVSGTIGRLDLSVELPDQVFLIIELKYRSKPKKTRTAKENAVLASLAYELLPMELVFESLSKLAPTKLDADKRAQITSEFSQKNLTREEKRQMLGQAVLKLLPPEEINEILASLVLSKLPPEELNQELRSMDVEIDLSPDSEDIAKGRIDHVLTKTAQMALSDITQKDYHGPFRLVAKGFIDLALVVYNKGSKVKALFGPETLKPDQSAQRKSDT